MKKIAFIVAFALASCAKMEAALGTISPSDVLTGTTWETEDGKARLVFSADQKVNSITVGTEGKTENVAGTYSYEAPFVLIYSKVETDPTRYGTVQGAQMYFASENAIYTRR